jgi:hypothetical protein
MTMGEDPVNQPAGSYGNFFAVDRRTFAKVSTLGLNATVVYLVQARGTGRDNRLTSWSIHAVEKYTAISRLRAREAIKRLCAAGIERALKEGTVPQYELLPACQVPGTSAFPRPDLDLLERETVEKVKAAAFLPKRDRWKAKGAVEKRWLIDHGHGNYEVAPEPSAEPDWIWLPNEAVTGAANEVPPVELLRQGQDSMLLRLFIDLYHAHNLRDDGGIHRKFLWQSYARVKVGEYAQYNVWGFRVGNTTAVTFAGPMVPHRRDDLHEGDRGRDLFRRVGQLVDLGLIEWVPHLFESERPEGEIIHAYGMGRSGDMEDRLGAAAHTAGRTMVTDGQYAWALSQLGTKVWLAPVPRHIADVQMVDVGRLRYCPRTKLTSAWWAELNDKGERFIEGYHSLTAASTKKIVG